MEQEDREEREIRGGPGADGGGQDAEKTAETRRTGTRAAARRRDWRPPLARWADRLAFLALALLVGWNVLTEHAYWRPSVKVRSCGGNFDMLCEFSRAFEKEHGCRVQYVAAPIQFLLELALSDDHHLPDVLVGRSGPGWQLLQSRGKLAGPRRFFAFDPIVIATPEGNPADIRSIEDLGREGVRVTSSPWAMRPKGMVFGHLMTQVSAKFYPGLVDRWERNMVVHESCGRLIGRALVDGRADAALVPLTLTTQQPLAGRCEVVEIPVELLDTLKMGRGSLPQSAGRMIASPESRLADAFFEGLLGDFGEPILVAHGYIPMSSPDIARFSPFLVPFAPVPMPPRQMRLAALLRQDGVGREIVRRYLKVIHTFGPNRECAEAWYRLGEYLAERGDTSGARTAWTHLSDNYPRPGRKEWIHTLHAVRDNLGDPETLWIERARLELGDLPPARLPKPLSPIPFAPIRVHPGNPVKGATRDLALAIDLHRFGVQDFALRDGIKVLSLHFPSPRMPEARAVAGAALYAKGETELARQQWEQVLRDHPESPWAKKCGEAIAAMAQPRQESGEEPRASGTDLAASFYDASGFAAVGPPHPSHAERGMKYGAELRRAGLPLYTLKECLKVLVGLYGKHSHAAKARYFAGVCLADMGLEAAAVVQWQKCVKLAPDTEWAVAAGDAIKGYDSPLVFRHADLRERYEIPESFSPPGSGMGGKAPSQTEQPSAGLGKGLGKTAKKVPPAVKRFRLGEELLAAGITEDDQAFQEFLKVLSVVPVEAEASWTQTAAHVRAAQCLLLSGRVEAARRHFETALRFEGPPGYVQQARRLLDKLPKATEDRP